jgi:CP family cyanate transporter-like MFS transporter
VPSSPRSLGGGRLLALAGILLVALNLRTAVGAISPILGRIEDDLPLDAVLLGLIGAAPPLIFALSGLIAPTVARRLGLERGLLAAMVLMIAGHLLRAFAPHPLVLLVGTVLAILGAGVGNVLLPPIVKRYFPDRLGTVTAVYVTIMSIGATVPPVIAVPLADASGWRTSLAVWAVIAVLAAAPWAAELIVRGRRAEPHDAAARQAEAEEPALAASIARSPVAWAMGLMFGATAMGAYAMFAWLPPLLVDTGGVDAAQAGLLLGVFSICGFPTALAVPVLAARLPSQRPIVAAGVLAFALGYAGLLIAPAAAPLLWAILVGFGALIFPLALTLINLRSRTLAGSVALSGFVQGLGYVIGAAGPLGAGLLHDATGAWTAPLIFLLASLGLAVPALVLLGRTRYVEDDLQTGRDRRRRSADQVAGR